MSLPENTQFGRQIEVRIKNFETNTLTTFNSGFDIECQFYKTIDEVTEASIGSVTVYNITDETFQKVNLKHCELEFLYGYVYAGGLKRLFLADVVSVDRSTDSKGNIITVFQVSINFRQYNFLPLTISQRETSLGKIVFGLSDIYDVGIDFKLDNIPEEHRDAVAEYVMTARVPRVSYVGNFKKFFDELKRTFGVILHSNEGVNGVASNGKKAEVVQGLTFMFANNQVPAVINKATKPYQKISSPDLSKDLFQEDVQDDIVTIFNYETGLLESPKVEYKIQKVPEDWKFNKGEEQTFESQVRQQNQNIKAAEAASKRAEREKKAKEKGKVLKLQKPKKKGTISIKRKFLKAKTLINADVRPRSLVQIESIIAENNGVYRVHSVTFTANNTSSSYMELQLESVDDTETQLTEQEEQELQESQSASGELGNEAQVGSTGDYE